MSLEASIDLRIVQYPSRNVASPSKILQKLIGGGWVLQHNGYIFYLPIGDNDMFDWTENKMDIVSFMKIVEEKEQGNELIGIRLMWQNTQIGGNFLLRTYERMLKTTIYDNLLFSLGADRKMLGFNEAGNITDVSWYLPNLLPIFNEGDTFVEHFTYDEHI